MTPIGSTRNKKGEPFSFRLPTGIRNEIEITKHCYHTLPKSKGSTEPERKSK